MLNRLQACLLVVILLCSPLFALHRSTSSLQDPSDRRWQVRCSPAETLALNTSALTCTSSGPVNRLPGVNPLRFTCPSQGFLSGFHSTYESHTGDRSWDPYCCQHSFGSVVNCQETPFLNAHGGNFNFSIPASVPNSARRVVVGFEGSYVGIVPARRYALSCLISARVTFK